ncbi:sulfatase-like hydrolase/transferase [Haloarchaeobius sp. HRN-SO-5]|uniref:sulfatase-like hydrolase/transferase n=1 Tax=Haloarchaeobius sp. HRN-SO-5 TaxID=3446118 RepID=UPI003EBC1721
MSRKHDTSTTRPHIFVIVGDCLRAATATAETMPFTRQFADLTFERCYAPSTWTLPSHASLYSQQTPIEHGVTRRGNSLSNGQATLPKAARRAGYRTSLFSENPTFSTHYGFHNGVAFVDDFVDSKLFLSQFAIEHAVDDVTVGNALSAVRSVLQSTAPVKNAVNSAFAPLSYALARMDTRYPHNGDRVLSHLDRYVQRNSDGPLLSFVNLLDPHNPHSVPPEPAASELGLSVSRDERKALSTLDDNKLYLFEANDGPPSDAQTRFDTWDDVFERRERIYEAQVRQFDLLVRRWVERLADDVRRNALIVVTGDHGQLFGEEGMVGHHTSLHPHGVQVPLYVKLPEAWEESRTVSKPVNWVGLSKALGGVTERSVTSGTELSAAIRRESLTDGAVVIAADGPTWNVSRLREKYDDERVDALAVRRIGLVEGDRQVVYESPWDESEITRAEYELVDGGRELVATGGVVDVGAEHETWLTGEHSREADAVVSARLERLGYL